MDLQVQRPLNICCWVGQGKWAFIPCMWASQNHLVGYWVKHNARLHGLWTWCGRTLLMLSSKDIFEIIPFSVHKLTRIHGNNEQREKGMETGQVVPSYRMNKGSIWRWRIRFEGAGGKETSLLVMCLSKNDRENGNQIQVQPHPITFFILWCGTVEHNNYMAILRFTGVSFLFS